MHVRPGHREKEEEMKDIEELRNRERIAYERFMDADWKTANLCLNEWLDAYRELCDAEEE